MDEDKDKKYVMRPVVKEGPNASTDDDNVSRSSEPPSTGSRQGAGAAQSGRQTKPWQRIQFSQIPTERIIKTMTNKDMMMQTLHDETMEPHVHLTILLLLVFVLAIIISLLGL